MKTVSTSDSISQRPYFIGLDILRLIAALAVVVYHLQLNFWVELPYYFSMGGRLGRLAVSFFFLLSGFLLSYLMFMEKAKNGKVNIRKFYIRRALRIWPLYFTVLIIAFWLYPVFIRLLTGYTWHEKGSVLMYFLYLCNYEIAYITSPVSPMLGVQWSLAVEEQFYLFLPWIFLLFSRFKFGFIFFTSAMIVFSLLFRTFVTPYYDTLSVMYSLFGGVTLAILVVNFNELIRKWMFNKFMATFCFLYIVLFMLQYQFAIATPLVSIHKSFQSLMEVFVFSFFVYHFAFNLKLGNIITKSSFLGVLAQLGKKYTYSVYLSHMVAIVFSTLIVKEFLKMNNFFLFVSVAIVGLLTLCFLAQRFIEKKFDDLKDKFYQS